MAANNSKIIVVTGSNKGIGLEIVKGLAPHATVILTARSENLGNEAIAALKKDGLTAIYHQLDVTNQDSISSFASWFAQTYPRLDVLINNAGIFLDGADNFGVHVAQQTLNCNYWGAVNLTKALLPSLHQGAKVINVASRLGLTAHLSNADFKAELVKNANDGNEDYVHDLAREYINRVGYGTYVERGFVNKDIKSPNGLPFPIYGTSKLLEVAYSKAFAKTHKDLVVNIMCPGFCATDLNGHAGVRTAAKGAETGIYLALSELPEANQSGAFYYDKEVIEW